MDMIIEENRKTRNNKMLNIIIKNKIKKKHRKKF